jgi:sugar lactone lactonase YvrE
MRLTIKIYNILMLALILAACSKQKQSGVELALDTQSELGEGAIWNHETNELWWIDIKGEILNFYNPATKFNKEMFTGQLIGTVVPTKLGNALVALQKGIYWFDTKTGSKNLLIAPEGDMLNKRFNDGKCDPSGRFWAGTMSTIGEKKSGALYRFDTDTTLHKMVENVSISNGIVWSLDASKMYYIDTPTQQIMAYDYDKQNGRISNPTVAVLISPDLGAPDGMTIDQKGMLWVALWGGAAVGCWNPETGKLLQTIAVPAKNVTSCAFGDEDLGTLYITTARTGTSEKELEEYPQAGGVFKIRPGVKGIKANFFDGSNN